MSFCEAINRRNNLLQIVLELQPKLTMAYPMAEFGKKRILNYHFDKSRVHFYCRRKNKYCYMGQQNIPLTQWKELMLINLEEAIQYVLDDGTIVTHKEWILKNASKKRTLGEVA